MAKVSDYDSDRYRRFTSISERDKAIHSLEGMLRGAFIDGSLNLNEASEIADWCERYRHFVDTPPFSKIIPIIHNAILCNDQSGAMLQELRSICTTINTDNNYYDSVTSDMQRLQGMLHGILADNEITGQELNGLLNWMNDHRQLVSVYPYDEIHTLVTIAMQANNLTDDYKTLLKYFFSMFIDCKNSKTMFAPEMASLGTTLCVDGICAINPPISFDGTSFCFTGKSSKTVRTEFVEIVQARGALFHNNVILDTNYLVVGDEGNPCWAFSCYGRKVEKAVNMRKSGYNILIVHETDFWNAL